MLHLIGARTLIVTQEERKGHREQAARTLIAYTTRSTVQMSTGIPDIRPSEFKSDWNTDQSQNIQTCPCASAEISRDTAPSFQPRFRDALGSSAVAADRRLVQRGRYRHFYASSILWHFRFSADFTSHIREPYSYTLARLGQTMLLLDVPLYLPCYDFTYIDTLAAIGIRLVQILRILRGEGGGFPSNV